MIRQPPIPETRHPIPETRHPTPGDAIGIYIHLPFCASKCNYCDFATALFDEHTAQRYLAALLKEIRHVEVDPKLQLADSIYFGGGTPSLVPECFIEEILSALAGRFSISDRAEISLEMNPSTAELNRAPLYHAIGINRLSIGVQSFDDSELVAMTRAHTSDEARRAVRNAAGCGFTNLSIDLILGLPTQTSESFRRTLQAAVALPVQHLSVYMLELHSGTPLHETVMSHKVRLPSEEFMVEQYHYLVSFLESMGLLQYEISNFARDGYQSLHNLKYWNRLPYLGFGVSSHSFDGTKRWKNMRSMPRYLEQIEAGMPAREAQTMVTGNDALQEQLFLGLRLNQGVAQTVVDAFLKNDSLKRRWQSFERSGWVEKRNGCYRFTTSGYLVSNTILSELM